MVATLLPRLQGYRIVLASNSPRRRELLAGLGLQFEVRVLPHISECFPQDLPTEQVAEFIAREKAAAYQPLIQPRELVITADTTVVVDGHVLGKPADAADARRMLRLISGRQHQVITGVCLTTSGVQRSFSAITSVTFKPLSDAEISFYIDTFHPFDKAGAYGIQEWIGYVGVTRLEGSYFNVMGLPVQRIYTELQQLSLSL
ncbi:MAG: septum formation protein Maf [Prevotella sp.]|nr:septum formation protein Maf [Prevotella sp.]